MWRARRSGTHTRARALSRRRGSSGARTGPRMRHLHGAAIAHSPLAARHSVLESGCSLLRDEVWQGSFPFAHVAVRLDRRHDVEVVDGGKHADGLLRLVAGKSASPPKSKSTSARACK